MCIRDRIGAASGAEWAVNNPTHTDMNSWFHYAKLYAATAGCIGFMMLKYKWSIGKTDWFKVFPFAIVAINILIAVASDFESGIRGAKAMMEFGDRCGSLPRMCGCTAAGGTG